jgi:glutamine synthetase type III
MFNPQKMTSTEIEQSGLEYGKELAAALVLASNRTGADIEAKREMAQIVLREIDSAVETLRKSSAPLILIATYEQACRAGVRDELQRSMATARYQPIRRAA